MKLSFTFIVLAAVLEFCYCRLPVFQRKLDKNQICREKICKFTLTLRDEFSMTRRVRPGRIWVEGETYLLEMQNGKVIQKLGTYYRQPLYSDLENAEITNITDDVITADGVRRSLVTINDVFPGPTFEVMEGSEVEVMVNNQMLHTATSMHWHGFHMRETPWMDGVGYVTQCPIGPKTSFMYRFRASPAGTLWYHAHLGGLRADGAIGLFIVHEREPEIPYYPLIVNHWIHMPFFEYWITNPYRKLHEGGYAGPAQGVYSLEHLETEDPVAWRSIDGVRLSSMVFKSILVNGRGQYEDNNAPISWFTVEPNSVIGFYIINPAVEYTLSISFDQHEIEVLDLGVGEVEPMTVNAVYLNPGERAKVRIRTKKTLKNYWIRIKTLNFEGEGRAIMHYKGSKQKEPKSVPTKCTLRKPCIVYNCLSYDVPDKTIKCMPSFSFIGKKRSQELAKTVKDIDLEVFLDFAFPIGATVNGFRFILPENHLYAKNPLDWKCSWRKCRDKACYCSHTIDLPYNKSVQLVLTNIGDKTEAHGHHHSIHLHGYDFVVVKTGFPEADPKTGFYAERTKDVYCVDRLCRKMRWVNYEEVAKTFKVEKAPIQDTVLLPYGGYTVVRIRTDNPGNWIMHCHQMMHAVEGMDVVIRVAPDKIPPVPKGFPERCGGFEFSHEEFQKYVKSEGKSHG